MRVKLGSTLTLAVIVVGAEEAPTRDYFSILGPDFSERELGRADPKHRVRLPIVQIDAETDLNQLIAWLQENFITDIMDSSFRSMKPQHLTIANRTIDMSKIFELVRARQQWPFPSE